MPIPVDPPDSLPPLDGGRRQDVDLGDFDQGTFDHEVLGLDNVRLELPLAGIGSRSLAATLDHLLILLLIILWLAACAALVSFANAAIGWLIAAMAIGSFLILWGYFSLWELLTDGQTPGKTALSIRTISSIGGKPSVAAILIRNLLRGIDYLVGLPLMAYDRRYRRLGDFAAATLVVHDRVARDEDEISLRRVPKTWRAREIAVAEAFLRRAPRLETEHAHQLATRLREAISTCEPEFVDSLPPTAEDRGSQDPVAHLRILLGVDG